MSTKEYKKNKRLLLFEQIIVEMILSSIKSS